MLSPTGVAEAAERWYRGRQGPATPGSVASAEACLTCGFLIPLQGPLGTVFGVCANEWSPDDGKVVALEHGCGAHSETDVEARPSEWPEPAPVVDELDVEVTTRPVDAVTSVDNPPVGASEPAGDADNSAVEDDVTVVADEAPHPEP